jgi:hypothetical protein
VSLAENIASGEVVVHILRDPNYGGGPGCTELGSLDITNATSGVLGECRIAGDAATLDEVRAIDLTGPVVVDGAFEYPVYLERLSGTLECAGLGDITVLDTSVSPTAVIRVLEGPYSASMYVEGNVDELDLSYGVDGSVNVQGGVNLLFIGSEEHPGGMPGHVVVAGGVGGLVVHGGISGELSIGDSVEEALLNGSWANQLSGKLSVGGDLNQLYMYMDIESSGVFVIEGGAAEPRI